MPQDPRAPTPYIQDRKSYGQNLLTREMHPTDGNMMGFEQTYGGGPADMGQMQQLPVDQTVKRFREMYGDEQAIMVLDELIKIQGEAGQGGRPPTEIESYGNARANPTDGNLMGHEAQYGYPPSVAQNPSANQTPFGARAAHQGPMNAFALQGRRK